MTVTNVPMMNPEIVTGVFDDVAPFVFAGKIVSSSSVLAHAFNSSRHV